LRTTSTSPWARLTCLKTVRHATSKFPHPKDQPKHHQDMTTNSPSGSAQDAEKLHDARVAALRKAVMTTAPTLSTTTSGSSSSSTSNSNSTHPPLAKNQASAFVRKMMKDSWIAQTDGQLLTDIVPALEGGCVYLPGFLGAPGDYSVLKALTHDLQHCPAATEGGGMVNWSQHLKFENPDFSPTFCQLLARLDAYFDVEILATRLNFYRDGTDWKPFHHDSHAYGSNGKKEDFTMGASFGSMRELAFRHEASGQVFTFPQANGDIFAFDSDVNRTFTHGVPKMKGGAEKAGPRLSLIAWGRRRTLNERNSSATAREADGGQRQERQEGEQRGYGGGGGHQQQKKKAGKRDKEEEEEEKVVPIGMDEVVRLVEKMVLKEEEKRARRALSVASASSSRGGGGGGGKEGGGGGKAVGGDAGATKENSSDNISSSSSSSANPAGRTRRAGRVQHSWAS